MKKFKDADGREWKVVINVGAVKRVRDETGHDLFKWFRVAATEPSVAETVTGDVIELVNVVYSLLRDQIAERKMSEDDFAAAMFGDTLEHATQALSREIADFFPSSQRLVFNGMLDKTDKSRDAIVAKALETIDALDLTKMMGMGERSTQPA